MAGVKDPIMFGLVHDFFQIHLTKMLNRSPNTVIAYREALSALFDFVKADKNISLSEITFEMIDHKMVAKFLDYLETVRGCSVETRNHRLNRIRAFYKYAAKMEPTAVIHRAEILKVPLKKSQKPDIIEYMSDDAVKAVLSQPDVKTEKGLRDQFLMVLLYDTAARIQEIMDIQLRDFQLERTPKLTLHGKGGKTRVVPIMESTLEHLKNYLSVFHPDENDYSEQFLFYVARHGEKKKMHHDTARRFIFAYGVEAKKKCPDVPDVVHPHLWRHTRSMGLYQRGMDLTLLAQWLGHAKVETTQIYAKADTEQKRRAIANATDENSPLASKLNAERFTISDDDILKRLYGLKD